MATHPLPTPLRYSHAQRWLLAYDIRHHRRLGRVSRLVNQHGLRLQYSVYLLHGSRQHIEHILEQLRQLIDDKEDDVRIYALTETTRIYGLGNQFGDEGSTFSDAILDKLIQPQAEPADRDRPTTTESSTLERQHPLGNPHTSS